jgi:hypothetical protein
MASSAALTTLKRAVLQLYFMARYAAAGVRRQAAQASLSSMPLSGAFRTTECLHRSWITRLWNDWSPHDLALRPRMRFCSRAVWPASKVASAPSGPWPPSAGRVRAALRVADAAPGLRLAGAAVVPTAITAWLIGQERRHRRRRDPANDSPRGSAAHGGVAGGRGLARGFGRPSDLR